MRAKFADIGGVRTRYLYEGSGDALLLIHGVGVSADSWLYNIDPLAEHHFVCAPDSLGQGFTEPGEYRGGPPYPYMVKHLGELMDALELDKVTVIGSSLGALLGALLYFAHPDRVQRLVLVSSGSCFNSDEEIARTLKESHANGIRAFTDPTLENCRKRMQNIFYDAKAVPEQVVHTQLTLFALPWAREAYERRIAGMMDIEASRPYRILDRLEKITVPTLVIWGLQDSRGIYCRAVEGVARMPDARLVAFDKCKHQPHIEQPAAFNRTVLKFLRGETLEDARATA